MTNYQISGIIIIEKRKGIGKSMDNFMMFAQVEEDFEEENLENNVEFEVEIPQKELKPAQKIKNLRVNRYNTDDYLD